MKPATWSALVSLTAMEVVLGIDNLVFISVLISKLPADQRKFITRIGVGAALLHRDLDDLLPGLFRWRLTSARSDLTRV